MVKKEKGDGTQLAHHIPSLAGLLTFETDKVYDVFNKGIQYGGKDKDKKVW